MNRDVIVALWLVAVGNPFDFFFEAGNVGGVKLQK